MKVEKNSPLAQMLLKLAAEHDPKLREAIRNGEVEGVNIIAVGGAPDGEVKELLESLAKDEDDCKNCENRAGCEDAKTATPNDGEDADDKSSVLDDLRELAYDDDVPEGVAMPARIVLLANDLFEILNEMPPLIAPKKDTPYTVRRAEMLRAIKDALLGAKAEILAVLSRYPEFAESIDKYFDDNGEEEYTTE